jgi:cytochrome c-type biogenesis protein
MIERLFTTLYIGLTQSLWLAVLASFVWGLLSILLSPCHLSSIPLVIGFIIKQDNKSNSRAFVLSSIFSFGILLSIALIGILTVSLGRLMGDVGQYGNFIVAVIFFVVGLYLMDVAHFNWSFGAANTKYKGISAALVLGFIFGLALGPCTFAFIAPILSIVFWSAQSDIVNSIFILLAFALGHCGIIMFFGTVAKRAQNYLNWTNDNKSFIWMKRICGFLVIMGGIYLIIK